MGDDERDKRRQTLTAKVIETAALTAVSVWAFQAAMALREPSSTLRLFISAEWESLKGEWNQAVEALRFRNDVLHVIEQLPVSEAER